MLDLVRGQPVEHDATLWQFLERLLLNNVFFDIIAAIGDWIMIGSGFLIGRRRRLVIATQVDNFRSYTFEAIDLLHKRQINILTQGFHKKLLYTKLACRSFQAVLFLGGRGSFERLLL